ncbi:hypothetical protein ACFSF0_00210 [Ottowia flava]|uniref:Uncharacterized protein n=1 Tax=Ottowia flava TaxID=2675430 RepID=A0ABW4KM02_9BURK|nr:hypothetical protein [Ottowia sp. GY511]
MSRNAASLVPPTRWSIAMVIAAACAVAACASGPKVPDWKVNSIGHVERFTEAYLKGDARVEAREFELARSETARTGRPELVARIELNRCAAHVASLDFDPCSGFEPLRADAAAPELAYAAYLDGQPLSAAQVALLPEQHRGVAGANTAALPPEDDPFGRLIAAGVLMRRSQATPDVVAAAVDTASAQGWRRPLLAWLGVQARLAEARGDLQEAERVKRRMDLVQPPAPKR